MRLLLLLLLLLLPHRGSAGFSRYPVTCPALGRSVGLLLAWGISHVTRQRGVSAEGLEAIVFLSRPLNWCGALRGHEAEPNH